MSKDKLSIFNIADNAKQLNQDFFGGQKSNELFDIRVENGKSTTFIVRPLPYAKDIANTMVQKYFYAIPRGENIMLFDSMTTFNDPATSTYHFCPISHIWSLLNRSTDPNVKATAEKLRRQTRTYMYVQVVASPAKPEFNGKIMPMSLPWEMVKTMRELADPSADAKALGKEPITAYDLFNGANLECTILGHTQFGTVMRKWTVKDLAPSEVRLPLGPEGQMLPVSQLEQADVLEYFIDEQVTDLQDRYGYKAPTIEVELAAHAWCSGVVQGIPGMQEEVDKAFPAVIKHLQSMQVSDAYVAQPQAAESEEPIQKTYTAGNPMQAATTEPEPEPQTESEPIQKTFKPNKRDVAFLATSTQELSESEPQADATGIQIP